MKTAILLCIAFLYLAAWPGNGAEIRAASTPQEKASPTLSSNGWLNVPDKQLLLDIRLEGVTVESRLEASEFCMFTMLELLRARYKIWLSTEFLDEEIRYYVLNLTYERPATLAKGLLKGLQRSRDSGDIDWAHFNKIFEQHESILDANRHFPWLGPPDEVARVKLVSKENEPTHKLTISTAWIARPYEGLIGDGGSKVGRKMGRKGSSTLNNFSTVIKLENSTGILFQKEYPLSPWQTSYTNLLELPANLVTKAILADLRTGMKPSRNGDVNGQKK